MNFITICRIGLVSLWLAGWTLQPVHAQTYTSGAAYMSAMNAQYEQFVSDMWAYVSTAAHSRNAKKVETQRKELLSTVLLVQRNIKKLPPYEGDASLRDTAASYFRLCYLVLNDDFAKIVNLEEIAEQSYDLMEAYLEAQEQANDKLAEASLRLNAQQEVFAINHNVNLIIGEQDKTSRQLEIANKVIGYHNKVYLIFFKSYKQDYYLSEAVKKGDINGILQNQSTMSRYAAEGLAELAKVGSYEGDATLLDACKRSLELYKSIGDEKATVLADFYLKKDNFEKIKYSFDAKPAGKRTPEDIKRYNDAVVVFNTAIAAYNEMGVQLNKARNVAIEDWNQASERFKDRHVP